MLSVAISDVNVGIADRNVAISDVNAGIADRNVGIADMNVDIRERERSHGETCFWRFSGQNWGF